MGPEEWLRISTLLKQDGYKRVVDYIENLRNQNDTLLKKMGEIKPLTELLEENEKIYTRCRHLFNEAQYWKNRFYSVGKTDKN